jgi:hypothetical protein
VKLVLGTTVAAIDILAKFSYSKNKSTNFFTKRKEQKRKEKKRVNEIVTKPENGLPFHFLFLANRQNKKPNLNNNTQKTTISKSKSDQ